MDKLPEVRHWRWKPAPVNLPEVLRWMAGDDQAADCVKSNTKRSVYALSSSPGEPPSTFVKHDHPTGFRDVVKTLLRPRVLSEYDAARRLFDAGVPVPEPIACAWLKSRGLLLSRAVPDAIEGLAAWERVRDNPARRNAFLDALGSFLYGLLHLHVWHPDLHLGNLLISWSGDRCDVVLADLMGCRLRPLDHRRRIGMLAVLNGLRDDLSCPEVADLLARVWPEQKPADLWEELQQWRVADLRRRWRGRRRKLLSGSSFVSTSKQREGLWRYRSSAALERLREAVSLHREVAVRDRSDLLKDGHKRCVSRVRVEGRSYVVKEFFRPFPLLLAFASDCRSWLANWRLEMAGFRVPLYLGWLRAAEGQGYLVMESVEGDDFCQALIAAGNDTRQLQELFEALRQLLDRLQRWHIVHGDLKTQNVIVEPADNGFRLCLIDNDKVHFDRRIGPADYARNCSEIRGTLPPLPGMVEAFEAVFGEGAGQ